MKASAWSRRKLGSLAAGITVMLGTIAGTAAMTGAAHAASQGPCDIYAAGGTPCVLGGFRALSIAARRQSEARAVSR